MKHFKLFRFPSIRDGTFGVLLEGSVPFCLTLERPWLNNEVGKSCIPDGEYICQRVTSPKFGITFQVCDVEGRTFILFHIGNLMDDSHGCIILGEQYEPLNGKNAIQASGKAFQEFLSRLTGEDTLKLTIKWIGEI
jgi:hypothetical protein